MSFGTDPEYFLVDATGKPVPAHVAGFPDKHAKLSIAESSTTGIQVFRDGYAVELNVPSSPCRETLAAYVEIGLAALEKKLQESGLTLHAASSIEIDPATLVNAPPDVLTFGCDPSWDAYSGEMKFPQIDALTHPYRYAGGHLHYSVFSPYMYMNGSGNAWLRDPGACAQYIRMLDLYVGVPLTLLANRPETYMRRRWYGQAGEFRFQTYGKPLDDRTLRSYSIQSDDPVPSYTGLEYRTPGPEAWYHPAVASFALGTMRAVFLEFGEFARTWDAAKESDIRDAVNTGYGLEKLLPYTAHPSLQGQMNYTPELWLRFIARELFQKLHIVPSELACQGFIYHSNRI